MIVLHSAIVVVRAYRRSVFRMKAVLGSLTYGERLVVGPRARIARGLRIAIGSRVNIASDVTIQTNLSIGDDVLVSSKVSFIGNDHDFSDPDLTVQEQSLLPRSQVVLGGDNLIGFGTTILGGVVVGSGVIVGAGSLVTKDLPPNTVCVGRPAAPIRARRRG